jgi:predicted dehydrogenase
LVIRGLEGSFRRRFGTDTVELALKGEGFEEVEVPPDLVRPWRVERDFIEAVRAARRGESWSVSPDFSEGLLYMRKVEAVHESARTGEPVKPALL